MQSIRSSETNYTEIPGCLDIGYKYGDKSKAIETLDEQINFLNLPNLEKDIFYAIIKFIIENNSPATAREIVDEVNRKRSSSKIEQKHIHPILKRLESKGLIIMTNKGRLIAVRPGTAGDLQNYWLENHFKEMHRLYGALSKFASIIQAYVQNGNGHELNIRYISNPHFITWVIHSMFRAKKRIIIVAKYFRSFYEFPDIKQILRHKIVEDNIDVIIILGNKDETLIKDLMKLNITVKIATKEVYFRAMLVDDDSGLVNNRVEKGERRGYYFENSKEEFNTIMGDYIHEVINTAKDI